MEIDSRIALRIKRERAKKQWTLDQLAHHSGVSRAMISKIERQATQPSAVLLSRLADALGLPLSALLADNGAVRDNVNWASEQPTWIDPVTGYVRRQVSPAGSDSDIDIVAIELPAHVSLTFDAVRHHRYDQQLVVLEGRLQLTLGDVRLDLGAGDCARVLVDLQHSFSNQQSTVVRYLLINRLSGPLSAP